MTGSLQPILVDGRQVTVDCVGKPTFREMSNVNPLFVLPGFTAIGLPASPLPCIDGEWTTRDV